MSEFASAEIRAMPLPDAMPVLRRGRHKNQSRGACFMEYTALLAGEPFTNEPLCVDGELAAVLRGANDILSDVDRPSSYHCSGEPSASRSTAHRPARRGTDAPRSGAAAR